MATPRSVLEHALIPAPTTSRPGLPVGLPRTRLTGHLGRAVVLSATASVMLTLLPGVAAAAPGDATSPVQAAQLVAEASHRLEIVTEQVNDAKVTLQAQQAAAAVAAQAVAGAQTQLDGLDDELRLVARSAYTSDDLSGLSAFVTSDSPDELLSQVSTLEVMAGHTNEVVTEVSAVAGVAAQAQRRADDAAAAAAQAVAQVTAKQAELQAQIVDYQAQFDALTADQQQQQVGEAHAGPAVAAPSAGSVVAGSAAAQIAVDTAMAQLGDPYVWGAGGPNSFDCSGLTQYAYAAAGISLPHSSRAQSGMGSPVSRSALQPGDLLFFYSPVSHVSMYIGNGQMVHASTSGTPVQVASADMSGFSGARRLAG